MSVRRFLAVVLAIAAVGASAACGGGEATAQETEEMVELARAWYADGDPVVCASMTEAMLQYGWEKSGDEGRAECRTLLARAEPALDVVVGSPSIDGDKATVEVTYGPKDDRKIDRLHFVLEGGSWKIDSVAVVATPGSADSESA